MIQHGQIAALVRSSYELDLGPVGAFLPARVPIRHLPPPLDRFLDACAELPSRYPHDRGGVRAWLDREFERDDPQVRRAIAHLSIGETDAVMTALSALGHTYRWDSVPPTAERFSERWISLPPGIAGPWGLLARSADQPRVGSAWSLHLTNWKLSDRPGGAHYVPEELSAESVRIVHNWLDAPVDAHLERFSVAFVLMEATGAKVLEALVDTIEAAVARRVDETSAALGRLHVAIGAMTLTFSKLVRKRTVDPAVWLELVQPTFAWAAHADKPSQIEGGPSGMQLGTIQALDSGLGIVGRSALAKLAGTSRQHMPRPHRRFLAALDLAGQFVRGFVQETRSTDLTDRFDICVAAVSSFRVTHRARGLLYLRSRPAGDVARASTGLTIGVDDDPLTVFDRSMSERIVETQAAMVGACRRRDIGEAHVVAT